MKMVLKNLIGIQICFVIISALSGCSYNVESEKQITISAAASLKEPLEAIGKKFKDERNIKININFGSSGVLQRQIEQGAPIDIFFPAGNEYMDKLINKGLIDKDSVKDILANSLVFILSNNAKKVNTLQDFLGTEGKLVLGEINTVPAGKYAKESLISLNIWSSAENRILYAKDVKDVVRYVESGEAEGGIIYKSDSTSLKNSKVIEEIPDNTHEAIRYPVGIVSQGSNKDTCREFIEYLQNSESKDLFKRNNFKVEE